MAKKMSFFKTPGDAGAIVIVREQTVCLQAVTD
jgi:hypothetical protein